MSNKSRFPKWSTPIRQAYLLELWAKFNNQCLLGHNSCNIAGHYAYTANRATTTSEAYKVACVDKNGDKIVDATGKQYLVTFYRPVKSYYQETITIRLYDFLADTVVDSWKQDDRVARSEADRIESIALHSLGEVGKPIRGRFSNIARDIFHTNAPLYYLKAISFDVLRLTPFAKIKIAGSYAHLFISLGHSLDSVSKNKKRKAMRYGKPLPALTQSKVDTIIAIADGCEDVTDVTNKIASTFSDEVEGVVFSSIHKAKGLEAKNIFLLKPDLLPHPMAKQPWELQQERNLQYVAYTRTLEKLSIVL